MLASGDLDSSLGPPHHQYKAATGVRTYNHWYERAPRHVQDGRLDPATIAYLQKIKGPATACPARNPTP